MNEKIDISIFYFINKTQIRNNLDVMIRYYPQRKKGRPPVYPTRKSVEVLRMEYDNWKSRNPEIEGFNNVEMYYYLHRGWDIDKTILYRLHGEYEEWLERNPGIKRFSEREFDLYLDENVSIRDILERRLPCDRLPQPDTVDYIQPEEFKYEVESISDNADELEYSESDDYGYVPDERDDNLEEVEINI